MTFNALESEVPPLKTALSDEAAISLRIRET